MLRIESFFFFNDTATTEIYTLSLHDALPIWRCSERERSASGREIAPAPRRGSRIRSASARARASSVRSEEHTSELQSQANLVCRLLLVKKKTLHGIITSIGISWTYSNPRCRA